MRRVSKTFAELMTTFTPAGRARRARYYKASRAGRDDVKTALVAMFIGPDRPPPEAFTDELLDELDGLPFARSASDKQAHTANGFVPDPAPAQSRFCPRFPPRASSGLCSTVVARRSLREPIRQSRPRRHACAPAPPAAVRKAIPGVLVRAARPLHHTVKRHPIHHDHLPHLHPPLLRAAVSGC